MKGFGKVFAVAAATVVPLLVLPATAHADSIVPPTFAGTIGVGGSITITQSVTVTPQSSALVDIMFLVDTTGSMGSAINNVRTGFANVVTALNGIATNLAFGVGEYKDLGDIGTVNGYREVTDLTTNTATVQTALGTLTATGGGDLPEANLTGLTRVANETSWRSGSQRFVVWVGDAPGHNPSGANTEATTIAALNNVNVDVYAASATSGPGLNAACGGADCTAGQATRIVNGVGGGFLGNFDSTLITQNITNALTSGVSTYNLVGLGGTFPSGVSVAVSPAYSGAFDRSIARTFDFTTTITGVTPGNYVFDLNALLNGTTVVSTELIQITVVGDVSAVPEPASLILVGLGLLGVASVRMRRTR